MWVMSKRGFFSISKPDHVGADEVVIRARVRADLVELQRLGFVTDIQDTPTADYPHRATVKATALAAWLGMEAMTLDYSNFKATIGARDPVRAALYARIWEVGVQLTTALRRKIDSRAE